MVGAVLESGLEGELNDELGYSKYDYPTRRQITAEKDTVKRPIRPAWGNLEGSMLKFRQSVKMKKTKERSEI